MMNTLKKFITLTLLTLVIQFKKLTTTQKLMKLKKITDQNYDKYIITQEFSKST